LTGYFQVTVGILQFFSRLRKAVISICGLFRYWEINGTSNAGAHQPPKQASDNKIYIFKPGRHKIKMHML